MDDKWGEESSVQSVSDGIPTNVSERARERARMGRLGGVFALRVPCALLLL